MNETSPIFLLAEDNEDDVFLMRRALRSANLGGALHTVENGQQAIDYLAGVGPYSDREKYPLPTLMFLDLKMPYVSGFEVLAWIRSIPAMRELPVVILTSSPEERDRRKAEQLGANDYCVKPPAPEMLVRLAQSFIFAQR